MKHRKRCHVFHVVRMACRDWLRLPHDGDQSKKTRRPTGFCQSLSPSGRRDWLRQANATTRGQGGNRGDEEEEEEGIWIRLKSQDQMSVSHQDFGLTFEAGVRGSAPGPQPQGVSGVAMAPCPSTWGPLGPPACCGARAASCAASCARWGVAQRDCSTTGAPAVLRPSAAPQGFGAACS